MALTVAADDTLRTVLLELESFDAVWLCAEGLPEARRVEELLHAGMSIVPTQRTTVTTVGALLSQDAEAAWGVSKSPTRAARARSRRPRIPGALLKQVVEALEHLHDLDWLQDSPLVDWRAVRERRSPFAPLPEAQALRGLLVDSARRAARHAGEVPSQVQLQVFLDRYIEGRRVAEIAGELGVSRERCSRAYRKQVLRLAGVPFVRLTAAA